MKLTSTRTTVSAFFLLSIVWSLWSSSRITSTAVKSSLSLSTINTTTTTKRTAEDSKDEDYNYYYNYSNNYNTTRIKEQLLQIIDVNQTKCGCWKCFYRAKESTTNLDMDTNINNSNIMEIGWAVTEDRRFFNHKKNAVLPTLSEGMMTGWTLAQELKSKYGIRHFLLGPPMALPPLTRRERDYLNTNMPKHNDWNSHDRFPGLAELLVQKQMVAPESNFLYKCGEGKHKMLKQLEAVMMDSKSKMVGNKTDFCQELDDGFRVAFDMFHEIPLYHLDFQVFINAHDGSVTHLDFDRLVEYQYASQNDKRLKNGRNECRRVMKKFLAHAWQLAAVPDNAQELKRRTKRPRSRMTVLGIG